MIHPETGEVLETREQLLGALTEVEKQLAAIYRVRRPIREEYAERFEPTLPERRARTQTQDRVARCPRCGMKLESEEAAE